MSQTDTADGVTETAATLAADLRSEGVCVLPRREVNRRVRERGEFDAVSHDAVMAGFEDADWAYDRHLYLDPGAVEERARECATEFREAGRVVATREGVVDAVADAAERGDEAGWERGRFLALLRRAFEADGWVVERVEGETRDRVLFFLPLGDLIAAHHPNGRPPLSTDDLLRLYVARSLSESV
jgi:hypothetical protein